MGLKNESHIARQLGVWLVITQRSNFLKPKWAVKLYAVLRKAAMYLLGFFLLQQDEEVEECKLTYLSPIAGDDELAKRKGLTNYKILSIFLREIHALSPLYFWISFALRGWWVIFDSGKLYYTSMLLDGVKECLESSHCSSSKIYGLALWLIVFTVLSNYLWKLGERYSAFLKNRVRHHFAAKKMREAMRFDVETSQDPEVVSKLSGSAEGDDKDYDYTKASPEAWKSFDGLCDLVFGLLQMISHLGLVVKISQGGAAFTLAVLLCFVHPVFTLIEGKLNYLYRNSFVSYCNNSAFRRMAAFYSIAHSDSYAEDRIMNNFAKYINNEFDSSRKELGDTDTEAHYAQWFRNQPLWSGAASDLSSQIPLLFFASAVTWDNKYLSLSSLIMLQQIMDEFQMTTYRVFNKVKNFYEYIRTIRNIYLLSEIPNGMEDGLTPYPPQGDDLIYKNGAEIEFKNVSFRYPGTDRDVISDVSFKIKSGQLVVIVGVNGSGKSSTIKLFSRLFDPTGGEIILDGSPLPSYRIEDVRNTTAILRQDHPVLPLSLRENIALGQPDKPASDAEVEEAVKQGGADHFIGKLKDGLDTVTCPIKTTETWFSGEAVPELKAEIEGMDKKSELSGGETQRLSASRTFLRLMGGNIRLLIADEPTSALDPEGEYEQFTRLREHSGGKTVIFITHRFGHLTKHADLILCLKDGKLVEQGKHEELLKNDGEYKKLYEIQSRAFVDDVVEDEVEAEA